MRFKKALDRFFKDAEGKWAIAQLPNILLSAWIILVVAGFVLPASRLHDSIALLQHSVLFAWAYLELTTGSSYFRKTLGGLVLVGIVVSFFLL